MLVKDFLEELENEFPEKLIELFEIEYSSTQLELYLNSKNLNPSSFVPLDFKISQGFDKVFGTVPVGQDTRKLSGTYTLDHLNSYSVGDIVYDENESRIKIFDGTSWVNVQ